MQLERNRARQQAALSQSTRIGRSLTVAVRLKLTHYQMGGAACLRGLRIPVATIVALVADERTYDQILAAYPDLEVQDIRQALAFAAEAVRERELPLRAG